MHPFRYFKAADVSGAIEAVVSEKQAMYLAGGTCLIDIMKLDVLAPTLLVDINALPLNTIEAHGDGIRIGALARNSDVAYHPLVHEYYPLVAQALLAGATAQLRNMATIGGNILQRTRCPYYRDPATPCNKREPASGCSALKGYSRPHAILGGSVSCIATYPSDLGIALAALDAVVQIEGPHGLRSVPLTELYATPENQPERETVLEHGELIIAVDLPHSPFATHSHYLKIRERASYAFATVSVAAALDLHDGLIRDARIALGGVAPRPWRMHEAEECLIGHAPHPAAYQAAATMLIQAAWPQRDNAFKVELARRGIVRALATIGGSYGQ
jgi:xanthine dehydrogenase YagS FAD-binding subunit